MLEFNEPFLKEGETLVCFGDSLTEGDNKYVKFLQDRLPKINVINAGRGGDKTPWALTRFQQDVIDRKPDAVSILLGANDAAIGRGCWADEPPVSAEAYRCNLIWMTHLCKLAGITKISIATPLASFEGEAYKMHGDRLNEYCLAARDAADYAHCRMVPLDSMMRRLHGNAPWDELVATRDGTHPVLSTYQAIAEAMIAAWKI